MSIISIVMSMNNNLKVPEHLSNIEDDSAQQTIFLLCMADAYHQFINVYGKQPDKSKNRII